MIQGVCSRPSGHARGRLVKVRLYSLAGSLMLICLQTRYFSWRARQDSNLRPSLFVVLLPTFLDVQWCPEVGLSKQLLFLAVRRRSPPSSFYYCFHGVVETHERSLSGWY